MPALSSLDGSRQRVIERLLSTEIDEAPGLRYERGAFHIGLIASRPEAEGTVRTVAARLDRAMLLASPDGTTLWAWLGGRRPVAPEEVMVAFRAALGTTRGDR